MSGAYAAGKRGAVFMQSSGFGNCINALSSLCIPSLIPFPMFVSLRGDLGEHNVAQIPGGRAVAPIVDALGLQHFSPTCEEELPTVLNGAIQLCYAGTPARGTAPHHSADRRQGWTVLRAFEPFSGW